MLEKDYQRGRVRERVVELRYYCYKRKARLHNTMNQGKVFEETKEHISS